MRRLLLNNGGATVKYSGIIDGYFEVESVTVFNPVNWHVYTTLDACDIYIMNRFYEDGLYGELHNEVLGDKIHWYGQVRPAKLTSTAFTFAAYDSDGNQIGDTIKLTVKVTR